MSGPPSHVNEHDRIDVTAANSAAADPAAESSAPSQDPSPDLLDGGMNCSADVTRTAQPPNAPPAATPPAPAVRTTATRGDPWAVFAAQRAAAAQAPRANDIDAHLPSMEDLEPLLVKHAARTLIFEYTLPVEQSDMREIIGWLHMNTGQHTKSISEDAAMASLLHDNHLTVKRCERTSKIASYAGGSRA
ncbi:hypothetical protein H310_14626 [Aphanomyces invadans]|uniref:Uncharacterized protein n=1 Tax=Aphanomyces invadans TaxID=157072 RepID=A0A024T9A1_9STRA|nr:hypothetical protein H310_14626 [Aphanomyces invadans]ETV90623.1 hypothetical protein H310_14626 [Aphanomyces invadans]|eukprot:XP_008880744.1 hypothetical protein H310_14626 [Aphanomyces invadans]